MTLDQPSLTQHLFFARQAISLGRKVLLDSFGRLAHVDEKYQAGLVTEADVESERVICEFLLKKFPQIPVVGEEGHAQKARDGRNVRLPQEACWILDPLDGTTNYVHQFPIFCISLGLMLEGRVVLGIVDAPKMDQSFHAIEGKGAFLNDQPIRVSQRSQIKDCLLATGFFSHDAKILDEQLRAFGKLVHRVRGVRRAGAAAYDLCMVAAGIFDGFWEQNLMPWDTAAGSLIVQEAGGVVTDFSGTNFHPSFSNVLAANSHVHNEILAAVRG